MPTLETPPNPTSPPPPPRPDEVQPIKVRAGRFGELDHTELVHLLDSLDDDRSRSRFRESVYISVIVYLAVVWFIFYGPRVLFHQGKLRSPAEVLRQRELTYIETPKDLKNLTVPKDTKAISDHTARAQTPHPTLDRKTLEQLQAMRRAGEAAPPRQAPLPPTPQPQQQQPQQQQPVQQAQNQPPPRPAPPANTAASSIPDAPRPTQQPTRPNFGTAPTAGDLVRNAGNGAARDHGTGGEGGLGAPSSHPGLGSGIDILSDTQGVDFGPYLRRLKRLITASWYPLIPEECYPPLNKEGQTLIRFTIAKNGTVTAMNLDGSTHDQAINKAAWGGITGVGQMPPLPAEFHGDNLELRVTFVITHDRSAAD